MQDCFFHFLKGILLQHVRLGRKRYQPNSILHRFHTCKATRCHQCNTFLIQHRRKVTLIVLADWSFLETDKYTPLDKLFADITSKHEIHGLLINGDIGYDLQTNNCHNYETFLVMLGSVTKSIPLIFATGNH